MASFSSTAPRRRACEVYKRLEDANMLDKIPNFLDPNLFFEEEDDDDEKDCFTIYNRSNVSVDEKIETPLLLNAPKKRLSDSPTHHLSYEDIDETRKKLFQETMKKIAMLQSSKTSTKGKAAFNSQKNCPPFRGSKLFASTPELNQPSERFGKDHNEDSFSNILPTDNLRKNLFGSARGGSAEESPLDVPSCIKQKQFSLLETNQSEIEISGSYNSQKKELFKTPSSSLFENVQSDERSIQSLCNEQNIKKGKNILHKGLVKAAECLLDKHVSEKLTFSSIHLSNDKPCEKANEFFHKTVTKTDSACSPIAKLENNQEERENLEKIYINGKVYCILSQLGSGGSCKVYAAYDNETKNVVAIKQVNLHNIDPSLKEGYLQEIKYLKTLQGSNHVINLFDCACQTKEILLVMEKGDTDFAHFLNNAKLRKDLTPLLIKFYWSQMLKAVAEIHKHGIVHSDLKPANFLLVSGHLKLIDFGISASVPTDMTSAIRETQVGTLNFMSPEAITYQNLPNSNDDRVVCKIGVKSDVWSLGCILYNLVYGYTPFQNFRNLNQKIVAIINPSHEIPFPPVNDPNLIDVMKKCLKRNPKERASVQCLLNHPYLNAEENFCSSETEPDENVKALIARLTCLTPRRISEVSSVVKKLSERS